MDKLRQKYNIISLNFADAKPPTIKEERNKEYICFGTERDYRNNYPQYLLDLYNRSAKHRALVDGKVDFINGRGWSVDQSANVTNQAMAQAKLFIASPNPDETLNKLSRQINFDDVLYGGYYLELIWSKDSTQIAEVNYIDFRYVRTNADKSMFYITEDWSSRKPEGNDDYEMIPAFNVNEKGGKQILAVDNSNSKSVYPLPTYLPAVPMIEADFELSQFDLSAIRRGFTPTMMLSFNNGIPTDEEAEELERMIEDKFSGTSNAGKFLLNFSDSKDRSVEVQPITPSNISDMYQVLEKRIDSTLLVAHRVINPILFGWKEGQNGLSNNADEMRIAQAAYQSRYATPKQEQQEMVFNSIISVNGLPRILEIKPLEPIGAQLDTATMIANLTQEEIRQMMGFEVLEGAANPVAEAIGMISPLVATKVLDNMSVAEIRALVGLPDIGEVRRTTTTTTSEFANEDEIESTILSHFESCGVDESDYEILSVKELKCTSIEDFLIEDDNAQKQLHKFAAIPNLSATDMAILEQVQNNPNASIKDLSRALKLPDDVVNDSLLKLQQAGALNIVTDANGLIERQVTKDGEDTVAEIAKSQLSIAYRYALRSDAPALKGRSRNFCISMMAQRKLYSRQEIDTELSNGMGLSVFNYRGGYYSNPNTGRTTAWCRHIWQQTIIRKKQ